MPTLINSEHKIKQVKGHYEVWNVTYNCFICSGDTRNEAEESFLELFQHQIQQMYIN